MVKMISLPETVNVELTSVTEELKRIANKPISPAMTISLLIAVYRAHLSEPCARDAFWQKISHSNFMSPEEFEKAWDTPPTKPKKQNKPPQKNKNENKP
jgi:phage portal protein BeeE